MWERTERCVVTFRTTTGAMAMESACLEAGLPGRLIPVPSPPDAACAGRPRRKPGQPWRNW